MDPIIGKYLSDTCGVSIFPNSGFTLVVVEGECRDASPGRVAERTRPVLST